MELLRETMNTIVNSRYPEMTQEGRKILLEALEYQEVSKGEVILQEGEVSRSIIFVVKGMLRQFYYKGGKDVTEHFSYEGSVLMCIESLLQQEPTRLIVEALEGAVIYHFPYEKLQTLLATSEEINIFYRRILEYSLITSQVKADSWRFETAHERYERLMQAHPEIIKRAPLSHIASYLLMTPETLSRVRSGVL